MNERPTLKDETERHQVRNSLIFGAIVAIVTEVSKGNAELVSMAIDIGVISNNVMEILVANGTLIIGEFMIASLIALVYYVVSGDGPPAGHEIQESERISSLRSIFGSKEDENKRAPWQD